MHSECFYFAAWLSRNLAYQINLIIFRSEFNTWEPIESVSTCKFLLEEFERNLAKQKELKAAQAAQQAAKAAIKNTSTPKTLIKAEPVKPGPSSAAQAG